MCSDSESAGGSSESRSMDSPTTSPGRGILQFIKPFCLKITLFLLLKLWFTFPKMSGPVGRPCLKLVAVETSRFLPGHLPVCKFYHCQSGELTVVPHHGVNTPGRTQAGAGKKSSHNVHLYILMGYFLLLFNFLTDPGTTHLLVYFPLQFKLLATLCNTGKYSTVNAGHCSFFFLKFCGISVPEEFNGKAACPQVATEHSIHGFYTYVQALNDGCRGPRPLVPCLPLMTWMRESLHRPLTMVWRACARAHTFCLNDWFPTLSRQMHADCTCILVPSLCLLLGFEHTSGPYVKCLNTHCCCTDGGHVGFGTWPQLKLPVSTLSCAA